MHNEPYPSNWFPELARQTGTTAHRDAVIEAAIGAGKFSASRRDHYRQAWDADPAGTERVIASLVPALAAPSAPRHSAPPASDDAYPQSWFPEVAARKAAIAQRGGGFATIHVETTA